MPESKSESKEVQRRIESIEGLIREIEKVSDPGVESLCKQLVQSLMDMHGSGIERMLEIAHSRGQAGRELIDEMGRDQLVGGLLLLYNLHPLDLRSRILQAIEKVRPAVRSSGANVELIELSNSGMLTLRLTGSCHSCASSAANLQSTVEQAIYDAAPDVAGIIVEGSLEESSGLGAFVPLTSLQGTMNARGSVQARATSVAAQAHLKEA